MKKTTLTINPFNLKVFVLNAKENKLEEFPGLEIQSYSTTSEELRIRFKKGYPFGVQFVKASEIQDRKVQNFEHLEKRVSVLIVDASANRDKVRRILAENEVKYIDQQIEKLEAGIK